jgi:signal recognition particle subunit SRP54
VFDTLSERLRATLGNLTGRGRISEADVDAAMREVRLALLEADVNFKVVKDFVARVREKAIGQDILSSLTAGQAVVKIVHDELVELLGRGDRVFHLSGNPAVVAMVGLQGSGKTTTTAKIAYRLTNRDRKKVLMASLDTRRPAAQEQLRVLGEQTNVATLPIIAGQTPLQIARRAGEAAKVGGFDVIIYDTAGRVTVDEELMDEVRDVKAAIHPHETLLVADSLTGQDAVNTAKAFDGHVGVTGIVLTRADGDGRGGAALSMRAVTGKPIKLIGVGEQWDALEDFHPGRIASRILGMGDVVSLVEKAAQTIDIQKATQIAEKMKKGSFDLEDLSDQLQQMQKLGGMGGVLGMLPGVAKIKGQINEAGLDKSLVHQRAIISSMTPKERRNPKILDAKRKRRIAAGSGTKPEDINKLIKMHRQMADMMKTMGRNGGMLNKFLGRTGGGPSEAELQSMQAELGKLDPKALEQLPAELKEQIAKGTSAAPGGSLPGLGRGLPGLAGGLPKGLPGLGGGMPKFPGLPGKKR